MWNNEEEKSQKRRRMVARTGTVGEKQKKKKRDWIGKRWLTGTMREGIRKKLPEVAQ